MTAEASPSGPASGEEERERKMNKNMKGIAAGLGVIAFSAVTCGSAEAETPQEQRNKQIAIDFYNAALNEKDWDKAVTYMGPYYKQHSIYMEDGRAGLQELVARIKKQFPENLGDIKRAFADGDIVVLHVHVTRTRQQRGWSVIEMMRIKNDKVVEHWDMLQLVPETAANKNTMF